ncbi:MAG TPA: 2-isopropylmalate synthase [Actinomycetota bacterium]|nr:2-isopropylmalate synthase [Actinomycetota bacterium]
MSDRVRILDTTLRDGEQSPGINLNVKEKLEIAEQLARLHVDVIEAGFPRTSQGDFDGVRAIADTIKGPAIAALARCVDEDIDRAWDALRVNAKPRIHVFLSTSDIHRKYMLNATEDEIVAQAVAGVQRAKGYTDDVEFSPQDATRTEPEFLFRIVEAVIEAGATTVNVPDTVGYAIPYDFGEMLRECYKAVPRLAEITLSVHCHNDLGLAVSNSIEAIRAGARQVEVAVNGIGERAGNCSLEEVVMAIATRRDLLNVETGINTRELARTSRLVSLLTGYNVQRNKAIVGENAFAHESGIHQHGVLQDRLTYEIIKAEDIGVEGGKIVLGKHSGRHAFSKQLEEMGFQLGKDELDRAFTRFKELVDRKIQITDKDLEAIIADEIQTADEIYRLESLQVAGGTHLAPTATVRVQRDGASLQESAMGDGMVDAVFGAVMRATGVAATLHSFNIAAVTEGAEALGDVSVQLEIEGERYSGRGLATDIVEASARAFLNALNRAARHADRGPRSIEPTP